MKTELFVKNRVFTKSLDQADKKGVITAVTPAFLSFLGGDRLPRCSFLMQFGRMCAVCFRAPLEPEESGQGSEISSRVREKPGTHSLIKSCTSGISI